MGSGRCEKDNSRFEGGKRVAVGETPLEATGNSQLELTSVVDLGRTSDVKEKVICIQGEANGGGDEGGNVINSEDRYFNTLNNFVTFFHFNEMISINALEMHSLI